MSVWSGRPAVQSDDAEQLQGTTTVNITAGTLDLGRDTAGLRYPNVTIPKNSQINSVTLEFKANASDSGTVVSLLIDGEAIDNAPSFTTTPNSIHSRTGTTATATFTLTSWVAETAYQVSSSNLAAIIQEIVTRPGWATGNAMVLRVFDSGSSTGRRRAYSRDGDAINYAPQLTVDFTEIDQTINAQVVAVPVVKLPATVMPGPVTIQAAVKQVPVVTLQASVTEHIIVQAGVKRVPVVTQAAAVTPGPVTIQAGVKQVPVVTPRAAASYGITAPSGVTVAGGGALVKIRSTDL